MSLYMAIIHYPVTDKNGATVTTSITNFDIHDMGRTGLTYGVRGVYLVTPVPSQQWFAKRVVRHWTDGAGAAYNATRQQSMGRIRFADDIFQMADEIEQAEERQPVFVATSAHNYPHSIGFAEMREKLESDEQTPYCLLFGTGWGLHPEIIEEVDLLLAPIVGHGDYNHLSVRGAAAIILDRLRGER